MSRRKYKLGICPECASKESDHSRKRLFQCECCERWFCKKHREPRAAFFRPIPTTLERGSVQNRAWQSLLGESKAKENHSHPDFVYTERRWKELLADERGKMIAIGRFLDGVRPLRPSQPPRHREKPSSKLSPKSLKKFQDMGLTVENRKQSKRGHRKAVIGVGLIALIAIGVILIQTDNFKDWAENTTRTLQLKLPVANFSVPNRDVLPGEQIILNGSSSFDPDNNQEKGILEYRWNFGDGTSKTTNLTTVKHTYQSIDSFSVTLVVVDDDNQTNSCTKIVETTWATPSIPQLEAWLLADKTNLQEYIYPSFVCEDFAWMLANHARTQKFWKMGIVYIFGYETTFHTEWNHAINAIITSDGFVYIEPQTDEVWWYSNHQPMQSDMIHSFWDYPYVTESVFVESVWIELDY